MFPTQNFQNQMQPQMQQQPMGYPGMQAQQPMMGAQTAQQNPGKYKTQLCRHFKNGNCSLSSSCLFAHGMHELRGGVEGQMAAMNSAPKANPGNYKTVQCKYFLQGFCKNAAACNFAHGDGESRNMMMGQQPAPQLQQAQQQLDPNVQILVMILQNLEQLFPQDQGIIDKLRNAQEQARANKTQAATQIILDIMEDPARTSQEKESYQIIYKNAQVYFTQVMQQQNQGQTQQQ